MPRTLTLPVARHCWTSRITKLTLTSNLPAVKRRDAPASTARTIRTRKSSDQAFGTTSSYTQDSNQLQLPGFTQVNAFVSVRPLDRVQVSVNANNLFDVAGYNEAEKGVIPANGIVRARSINGRTISASVRFDF